MGGRIHACYSTGTVVVSDRQIGGLVGRIEERNAVPATVEDAYSLCAVSGQDRVGGLVGKVVMGGSRRVIHAYSAGPVTGTGSYVGALIGRNGASSQEPVSLYWVVETADHDNDSHANPKTLSQMRRFTTFLWWDFKGESINGNEGVWNIGNGRNEGMPYFAWQFPEDPGISATFSGGSGTEEDPFLIATPDELALISFQYLNNADVHFALAADIDLGVSPFTDGEGWVPAGTNQNRQVFTPLEDSRYFSGHFDGRGHMVSNLFIDRPRHSYQGFFGHARDATIQNIELRDVDITAGIRYLGGLAGRVYATAISRVGVTGAVRGAGTLFLSSDMETWSDVLDADGAPLLVPASADDDTTEVSIEFEAAHGARFFRVKVVEP